MNEDNGNGIIFKIRSKVIMKKVFSLIIENHKLSLLTYNKKLQNKLFLDINNYKNISQKYQKVENNNEKIKQYILSTDILLKELTYETYNNKIIGREYDGNGNLKFFGEYINNRKISGKGYDNRGNTILIIKNGKGKEYYNNGKVRFQGDYLNGKRWNGSGFNYKGENEFDIKYGKGNIKEYDYYGNLLFEGEYLNGKRYEKEKNMI